MYNRFLVIIFIGFNIVVSAQRNCENGSLGISDEKEQALYSQLEQLTGFQSRLTKKIGSSATYIIPVVFHIFHNGDISNVSETNILKQLAILNSEFRRQQADTIFTPKAFKPLAAGMDIEFRLATLDPAGNCTNGINRIYTTMFSCANVDSVCKLSIWPADKYLNIWMGEDFRINNPLANYGGQCVPLGIGTWPWIQYMKQGVIYSHSNINKIGNTTFQKGITLVHEIGHFLNLRHIWGDSLTCSSDSVADTPPAVTFNTGCPVFPRRPLNACGSSSLGEMYCNYMDYTFETCLNMFTAGQVNRMDACLNSTVAGRSNLWSATNLLNTGTADPYIYPGPCAPLPEIKPYEPVLICAGDSVLFTDISYGGQGTTRSWNFYNNHASSLTHSVVWVRYDTPGKFSVELSRTFGSQTNTKTFLNKVTVLPVSSSKQLPYTNSFESQQDVADWQIVNSENDTTWRQFSNVAATGNFAMGVLNYHNNFPLTDDFISPRISSQDVVSLKLSFKLSFALQNNFNSDNLKISYTTDCGKTWKIAYDKSGQILATAPLLKGSGFFPATKQLWRKDSVVLKISNSPSILFRYSFTSHNGNNIFIDDINIEGQDFTSVNEINSRAFRVFPNPSKDVFTIEFSDSPYEIQSVTVINSIGQIVKILTLPASEARYDVDLSQCGPGVYQMIIEDVNHRTYTAKIALEK